jgi:hypothetical protein
MTTDRDKEELDDHATTGRPGHGQRPSYTGGQVDLRDDTDCILRLMDAGFYRQVGGPLH